MKTKAILSAAIVVLSTMSLVQAQEGQEAKLSTTLEVTYLSRYIWRGIDLYEDDHPAFQSSVDLDLYGTGFGTKILWSRPFGSGHENMEWFDYTLYYKNTLFQEEAYATNYVVGWNYYHFPDEPREARDMQDLFASLSWPKICPFGVVPSYTLVRMWPSKSGSTFYSEADGWMHVFGLGYDLKVPGLIPQIPLESVHLSTDLAYNDGVLADHEWACFVFGGSTDLDLGNNLSFSPGVYYQASMDDSLNPEDEIWFRLSVKYRF